MIKRQRRVRCSGLAGFESLEPRIVLSVAVGGRGAGSSAPTSPSARSLATSLQVAPIEQSVVAFPGAAGFGASAQGGRGGDVFHVTNLNDHGPGSLRDAIRSATGPRTVVFDVSGTIHLNSMLLIDKPNLTIAGQTAPGDGITLSNFGAAVANTNDVVIRYLRFRPGDTSLANQDSLQIYHSEDVIVDHISASWSVDETIDVNLSTNVTIQWSLISEGLQDSYHSKGPHSAGVISVGGAVSLHHNLLAHQGARSPLVRQQADVVNNVIYDWGGHGTVAGWSAPVGSDPDGPTEVNLQGNYYIAGPSAENAWLVYLGHRGSRLWQSGNLQDINLNGVLDGVPSTHFTGWSEQVDSRFDYPVVPTDDAFSAYDQVLREAGASLVRDLVDQRIVHDVATQSGAIIDSQDQVGGWPQLASEPAPLDSDQDGMPDWWEKDHRLNPTDPADANGDRNRNGYTDLEDYLHQLTLAPRRLATLDDGGSAAQSDPSGPAAATEPVVGSSGPEPSTTTSSPGPEATSDEPLTVIPTGPSESSSGSDAASPEPTEEPVAQGTDTSDGPSSGDSSSGRTDASAGDSGRAGRSTISVGSVGSRSARATGSRL